MSAVNTMTFDELREEFDFLGNWEEQCRYLIEVGEELPDLDESEKTEEHRVLGCQSRVWVLPSLREVDGHKVLDIRAKSDARIVDGLIVVLLSLTQGKSPREILHTDYQEAFTSLGLESQLVPQRRNGLYAMVSRIQEYARRAVEKESTRNGNTASTPRVIEPGSLHLADEMRRRVFDAEFVREEFPTLNQQLDNGLPVTYLDSASSSQKPQVVIDKEREVYEQYYANAYRGVYQFGDRVSRELEQSREKVARYIGAAASSEIVFTSGTTMAINIVAQAWGRKFLKEGDEILLNVIEHHANFVPWQRVAEQTGATIRFIPLTDDGRLDLSKLNSVLSSKTRLLAITGMSNVLGTVPPLRDLIHRAHAVGAKVLVDGAQSAAHIPTNVIADEIDFFAFSGHKIYGPSGVGVLYGRKELLAEMDPFLCGGHMIAEVTTEGFTTAQAPAKFEAGTPAIAQAIAMGTALDYLSEFTLCPIHKHEQSLLRQSHEQLAEIPGLKIYGPSTSEKGAIVSFSIDGVATADIAQLLDLKGVYVRHGHHCTMPLHHWLGVPATVRASFGLYNTPSDVERLADGIRFALKQLNRS